MAALSTLQSIQESLIRKSLNFSFFIAPSTANAVDATLFDATTGALKTLPAGYTDLGYLTDDGSTMTKQVNKQEVTSFQSLTPTRSDITGVDQTIQAVAQETKLWTIGLRAGVDTSDITADATSGVVMTDESATPKALEYRLLVVAEDQHQGLPVVMAHHYPRVVVDSYDNQSLGKGSEVQWPVTFKALADSTLATAHRWLFGGEGWLALKAAMGFGGAMPFVSSIDPATGGIAGGDLIEITGQSFIGATAVKFGSTSAASFDVHDANTIYAVTPALSAGTLEVKVTTPVGTSTGGATIVIS